jgi:hypothetical protein
MDKIPIELSMRLQSRLKAAAKEEGTSLEGLISRACECYLRPEPKKAAPLPPTWSPPEAADMGRLLAPESEWRKLANEALDEEERQRCENLS